MATHGYGELINEILAGIDKELSGGKLAKKIAEKVSDEISEGTIQGIENADIDTKSIQNTVQTTINKMTDKSVKTKIKIDISDAEIVGSEIIQKKIKKLENKLDEKVVQASRRDFSRKQRDDFLDYFGEYSAYLERMGKEIPQKYQKLFNTINRRLRDMDDVLSPDKINDKMKMGKSYAGEQMERVAKQLEKQVRALQRAGGQVSGIAQETPVPQKKLESIGDQLDAIEAKSKETMKAITDIWATGDVSSSQSEDFYKTKLDELNQIEQAAKDLKAELKDLDIPESHETFNNRRSDAQNFLSTVDSMVEQRREQIRQIYENIDFEAQKAQQELEEKIANRQSEIIQKITGTEGYEKYGGDTWLQEYIDRAREETTEIDVIYADFVRRLEARKKEILDAEQKTFNTEEELGKFNSYLLSVSKTGGDEYAFNLKRFSDSLDRIKENASDAATEIVKIQDAVANGANIVPQIVQVEKSLNEEKNALELIQKTIAEDSIQFKSKSEATEALRAWKDILNQQNGYEHASDTTIVGYVKTLRAAKKAGVAQSTLNRFYDAGAIERYEQALELLRNSFDVQKQSIKELENELQKLYDQLNNVSETDKLERKYEELIKLKETMNRLTELYPEDDVSHYEMSIPSIENLEKDGFIKIIQDYYNLDEATQIIDSVKYLIEDAKKAEKDYGQSRHAEYFKEDFSKRSFDEQLKFFDEIAKNTKIGKQNFEEIQNDYLRMTFVLQDGSEKSVESIMELGDAFSFFSKIRDQISSIKFIEAGEYTDSIGDTLDFRIQDIGEKIQLELSPILKKIHNDLLEAFEMDDSVLSSYFRVIDKIDTRDPFDDLATDTVISRRDQAQRELENSYYDKLSGNKDAPQELIRIYNELFEEIDRNEDAIPAVADAVEKLNQKAEELGVTFDEVAQKWKKIGEGNTSSNLQKEIDAIDAEIKVEEKKLDVIRQQSNANEARATQLAQDPYSYFGLADRNKPIYDLGMLREASARLSKFDPQMSKRSEFDTKVKELFEIIEKYFISQYGIENNAYADLADFMKNKFDLKYLFNLSQNGIKGEKTKDIEAAFRRVVNDLKSSGQLTSNIVSNNAAYGLNVFDEINNAENEIAQTRQRLFEEEQAQLHVITQLQQKRLNILTEQKDQTSQKISEEKAVTDEAHQASTNVDKLKQDMVETGQQGETASEHITEGMREAENATNDTVDAVKELDNILNLLSSNKNISSFADEYKGLVNEYHNFSDEEAGIKKINDRLKELYSFRGESGFEKTYGNEIVSLMEFLNGAGAKVDNKTIDKYFSNPDRFKDARESLLEYSKLVNSVSEEIQQAIKSWEFSDTYESFEDFVKNFVNKIASSRKELDEFTSIFPSKDDLTKNLYSGYEEVDETYDCLINGIKKGSVTAKQAIEELNDVLSKAVPFSSTGNSASSGSTALPSQINKITEAEDEMGNEGQSATDQMREGLTGVREEAKDTLGVISELNSFLAELEERDYGKGRNIPKSQQEEYNTARAQISNYIKRFDKEEPVVFSDGFTSSAKDPDKYIHTITKLNAYQKLVRSDAKGIALDLDFGIITEEQAQKELLVLKSIDKTIQDRRKLLNEYKNISIDDSVSSEGIEKQTEAIGEQNAEIEKNTELKQENQEVDEQSGEQIAEEERETEAIREQNSELEKNTDEKKKNAQAGTETKEQVAQRQHSSDTIKEETTSLERNTEERRENQNVGSDVSEEVAAQERVAEAVDQTTESIREQRKEKQKNADSGTTATAQGAEQEAEKIDDVRRAADGAGEAKEGFAEANKEVLESILASLKGLSDEGDLFKALEKVIKTLSKEDKINKAVEGLQKLHDVLSSPINDNSILVALQKLAEQGDSLKALAKVLKASKKQIATATAATTGQPATKTLSDAEKKVIAKLNKKAYDVVRNHGGGDLIVDDFVKFQDILKGIIDRIEEIGGSSDKAKKKLEQFLNTTKVKNPDGIFWKQKELTSDDDYSYVERKGYYQNLTRRIRRNADDTISVDSSLSTNFKGIQKEIMNTDKALIYLQRDIEKAQNLGADPAPLEKSKAILEDYLKALEKEYKKIYIKKDDYTPGTYQENWYKNERKNAKELVQNEVDQKRNNETAKQQIKDINDLYKERENNLKEIHRLQLENLKDNIADSSRIANEQKIHDLSVESLNIQKQLYATGSAQVDKEDQLVKLANQYNNDVKQAADNQLAAAQKTGQSRIDGWIRDIERLKASDKYIDSFKKKLDAFLTQLRTTDLSTMDAGKLSQELKDLGQEFNKLQSDAKLDKFTKANGNQIEKLGLKIQEFMGKNSKMGREFKNEFDNLVIRWRILNEDPEKNKEALKELGTEFTKLQRRVAEAGETGKSFFDTLGNRIKQMTTNWIAMYFSMYDIIRYIRTITTNVTELDSALTELRKVSDASTARLAQNFETSARTAQELGSTIKDVINITSDWARLGYNVDQAEELARVTTLFKTVGDNMTAESASEAMISTLKGFSMGVDEAERIVDRYNEVANNFAIDTAGISTAIEKSGASLYAAGNDLNKALGMIVAANDSLQNPETVGTTLKTISMRLRGASVADLEELGIDTEGMSQGLKSVVKQFKAMADIDIMEGTNYKDTFQILDELYEKWNDLTDAEHAALTEAVAGKRGGSVMSSLMNNWEDARDTVETAAGSFGSAAKEQENYAKSVQYSIDRVKASVEELSYDFLDAQIVKGAVEGFNSFLQILDKIIDDMHALIPLLGSLGGAILSIKGTGVFNVGSGHSIFGNILDAYKNRGLSKKSIDLGFNLQDVDVIERYADAINSGIGPSQQLQNELSNCSKAAQSYVVQCSQSADASKNMATDLRAVTAGAKTASVAMNLLSTAINMAVIALASFVIEKIIEGIDHLVHAYEYAEDAFNECKEQIESLNSELETTIDRLRELESKDSLTFVEQEELNKLRRQNELLALQLQNEKELLEIRQKKLDKENQKRFDQTYNVTPEKVKDIRIQGANAGNEVYDPIAYTLVRRSNTLLEMGHAESPEAFDLLNQQLNDLDDQVQDYVTDLLNMLQNAEATGNKTLEDKIRTSLKTIYEDIGETGAWNSEQFTKIFDTDGLEKTQDELVELAHAGKLNVEEFPKLAKAIKQADFIGASNEVEAFNDQLEALWSTTEEGEAYYGAKSRFGSNMTPDAWGHTGHEVLTQSSEDFNKWLDNQQSSDYFFIDSDEFAEELENQRKLFAEHSEESKQIIEEANAALKEEYKKISDWGLEEYYDAIKNDSIQHVFGNVNMDKRAIITWSEALKQQFADELKSWNYNPSEGGVDTVFGGSDAFSLNGGNIEVSFTPILVDENGNNPQFLSEGTVKNYIQTVLNQADEAISQSGEEWTPERVYAKALEIDAEGINTEQYTAAGEIVGKQFVHGIIAGIDSYTGEGGASIGADIVGMLMHFVGQFGAIGIETDKITEATNGLGDAYSHTEQEAQILDATLEKIKEDAQEPFSAFENTAVGERIQHLNDLFKEGDIAFREYMDSLQTEFDNFDASSFTNSLEEAQNAEAKFFIDSAQVAAQGLGNLFEDFDSGVIDVNEYLDGYVGLAGMVNTLTDSLQENSAAWSEDGQAMSDAQSQALDSTQQMLSDSVAVIESFQDSIYSLTQLNSGAIEAGTDEYKAHIQVIAEDIKGIIDSGGEDAELLAARLGTTTEEIAQNMTDNVANMGVAEQAIMDNTNNAITNMATAIGTLFENIGKAIKEFKVDLEWEVTGNQDISIAGKKIFSIPKKITITGSGSSLSAIGDAVSQFGQSVKQNIEGQKLTLEDFHPIKSDDDSGSRSSKNKAKSAYKPKNATKNYDDKLKKLQDSKSGGGGSKDKDKDAADDFYDYFERLIKNLDQQIDLLKAHLEDVVGSFAKNTLLDAQENAIRKKMEGYSSAIEMYQQKAQEALNKLPADVASKLVNGAVEIEKFVGEGNEEVTKAISEYEQWADKVADCKQQLVELREALRQLELEKFNNIIQDFEEITDVRSYAVDMLSKQIDLFEASGKIVGRGLYDESIEQTEKQLAKLYEERAAAVEQANKAVANGVDVASDEWFTMLKAIEDVDAAILDAQKSVEEYKKSIIQLYVDAFDREADRYSKQIQLRQDAIDGLEKQISVIQTAGRIAGAAFFEEQIEQTTKQIAMLQNERQELASRMSDAINNGVKVASDEWYEMESAITEVNNAILDAQQSVEEYKKSIIQLYVDAFDREADRYSKQVQLRQNAIDSLEKEISVIQSSGNLAGSKLIEKQIEQVRDQIFMYQKERQELMRRMSDATANGVKTSSEEWYSMVEALHDVDSAIQDCEESINSLDDAILALHTATFERIQSRFSSFNNELSNMRDMFADMDVATKDNAWTKEGLSQLGLLSQQYELAKHNVETYNQEIAELNDQYLAGKYSVTEYTEKLAELKDNQWSEVQAAKSAKDAIVDLNKARVDIVVDGINEEIDAFKKLTDAQLEALDAEKDLHDYEKSLAESNKEITKIQKQLAAIQNDNSASARAKAAKLREQLAEAQENLSEKEYDHSIETQRNALQKQAKDYEEARNKEIETLQKTLDDEEQIIYNSFEQIRVNAETIGNEILAMAKKLNIEMSPELTDPWKKGEAAIGSYSGTLDTKSSEFIRRLSDVETSEWQLQEQANATSEAIAAMFDNKADNLVIETNLANDATREEETAAWNASAAIADAFGNKADDLVNETNKANDALREEEAAAKAASSAIADAFGNRADALVCTIENARNSTDNLSNAAYALSNAFSSAFGSYDTSGIVGALNQVAGAASSAASSTRDLANAMSGVGAEKITPTVTLTSTNRTYDDIWDFVVGKHGGTNQGWNFSGHATGLKKADQDELAWTQELGAEAIISPTRGSILTPIKAGDSVLNAAMTDNLWKWGELSPSDFVKGLTGNVPQVPVATATETNNTMTVGSLIEINGPVNDSVEMMKIAANQASKIVTQSFKKLNDGLHK